MKKKYQATSKSNEQQAKSNNHWGKSNKQWTSKKFSLINNYAQKYLVSWVHEATLRITCTWTLKQSVCQIPKTNNVTYFSFHVLCP